MPHHSSTTGSGRSASTAPVRSGHGSRRPARFRDPQKLAMKLWVNDELMQDSNTGKMIFSTAEQIAQLSTRVTLWPGDLVLTGTPAGVGMARRRFLKPGDSVKLWIEGIGELTNEMTG